MGELARACLDANDIFDAAGFDVVIIETVGVGQDEADIASAAHSIVVVSAPVLGDGVQAIKAGVLEIADIHVDTKCDKPDTQKTIGDLKSMIRLGLRNKDRRAGKPRFWQPTPKQAKELLNYAKPFWLITRIYKYLENQQSDNVILLKCGS